MSFTFKRTVVQLTERVEVMLLPQSLILRQRSMFHFLKERHRSICQVAVYGLGVCAELGGSSFKSLVREALSRLNVVLRHPNAVQSENLMAYDNAVSALGKFCNSHRDSIDSAQVIPAWLNCLPIKGDLIEAKVVHDQLCSMVERSDRELLGPNNEYLPKVVQIFAEVLCAGKDLVTEQTASSMITLVRQLQQTLPPDTLASILSSLQPQKANSNKPARPVAMCESNS